jgi:hypothetical protein
MVVAGLGVMFRIASGVMVLSLNVACIGMLFNSGRFPVTITVSSWDGWVVAG